MKIWVNKHMTRTLKGVFIEYSVEYPYIQIIGTEKEVGKEKEVVLFVFS